MKYAPLIYCAIGFWMFGNHQIFGTDVYFLKSYSQKQITNHNISNALKDMTFYNEPLLLLFIFLFANLFIEQLFKITFLKNDLASQKNEDIKFVKVLSLLQRKDLINSEKLNRELGFKKLDNEFLKKLQEAQKCRADCKTAIIGIHTYQILDNDHYQTKF